MAHPAETGRPGRPEKTAPDLPGNGGGGVGGGGGLGGGGLGGRGASAAGRRQRRDRGGAGAGRRRPSRAADPSRATPRRSDPGCSGRAVARPQRQSSQRSWPSPRAGGRLTTRARGGGSRGRTDDDHEAAWPPGHEDGKATDVVRAHKAARRGYRPTAATRTPRRGATTSAGATEQSSAWARGEHPAHHPRPAAGRAPPDLKSRRPRHHEPQHPRQLDAVSYTRGAPAPRLGRRPGSVTPPGRGLPSRHVGGRRRRA